MLFLVNISNIKYLKIYECSQQTFFIKTDFFFKKKVLFPYRTYLIANKEEKKMENRPKEQGSLWCA